MAVTGVLQPPAQWLRRGETWLVAQRHSRYGFAAMRIGSALVLLAYLIYNLPGAARVWGPGSAWLDPQRTQLYGWPFDLLRSWGASPIGFSLWYMATLLVGVAMLLGWRTRVATPLMYVLFTALIARNPLITDNGDLAFRLVLIYTTFADTSGVWSLDARRRARRAALRAQLPEARWRRILDEIGTIVHNFALIVLVANLCMLYFAAGILKVQEPFWVDGTAVYYTMAVQLYQPWPWLTSLLSASGLGVNLATYFSVVIEVLFPVLIIYRQTRRVALAGIIAMHLGIAVLMGLGSFSAFMAMMDAILVSTTTYRWLERTVLGGVARIRGALGAPVQVGVDEPGHVTDVAASGDGPAPARGSQVSTHLLDAPTATP